MSIVQGIRNTVNDYLLSFGGYDWLWKDDKDEAYDDFMSKNPSLDHYEAKLKTFSATEDEIGKRKPLRLSSYPHRFSKSVAFQCLKKPIFRTLSSTSRGRCKTLAVQAYRT